MDHTTEALVQPALVPEVWLSQRDAQRGNNLFSFNGLVEVPNFESPLRDQGLHSGLLPDRLIKRLLEGRDVTPPPLSRTSGISYLLVLRMKRTSAPKFWGSTLAFMDFRISA